MQTNLDVDHFWCLITLKKKIIYKLLLSIYELVKLEKTDIIVVLHKSMISDLVLYIPSVYIHTCKETFLVKKNFHINNIV